MNDGAEGEWEQHWCVAGADKRGEAGCRAAAAAGVDSRAVQGHWSYSRVNDWEGE